jgi:hypothetical protein
VVILKGFWGYSLGDYGEIILTGLQMGGADSFLTLYYLAHFTGILSVLKIIQLTPVFN